MLTFGMGASTGIVCPRGWRYLYQSGRCGRRPCGEGKTSIPEDDPRNPPQRTRADNVGDNVGDVAGMGMAIFMDPIAALSLLLPHWGSCAIHTGGTVMQFKAVIAPMLIAAVGILLSIIGIFSVRTKENAKMKRKFVEFRPLSVQSEFGTLMVAAAFFILWLLQLEGTGCGFLVP